MYKLCACTKRLYANLHAQCSTYKNEHSVEMKRRNYKDLSGPRNMQNHSTKPCLAPCQLSVARYKEVSFDLSFLNNLSNIKSYHYENRNNKSKGFSLTSENQNHLPSSPNYFNPGTGAICCFVHINQKSSY